MKSKHNRTPRSMLDKHWRRLIKNIRAQTKILGKMVSITEEYMGISQLLRGHVLWLPLPKSTPM